MFICHMRRRDAGFPNHRCKISSTVPDAFPSSIAAILAA
jgi:hypothetical protein